MASRLTVIFYILLCLEAGIFLTLLPWWQPWGMGDWGDNFFLVMAAQKTGLIGLQRAVASGWVRGAVTGLGLLNLSMAFWEIFHFRQTVRRLQSADAADAAAANVRQANSLPNTVSLPTTDVPDAARASQTDHLSHHGRRDD
jgi:hypothetical protein